MAGIIERNVGNLHDQDTGLLVGYRNPVTGGAQYLAVDEATSFYLPPPGTAAANNAAIAEAVASGASDIYFREGVYEVSAACPTPLTNQKFYGRGKNLTTLRFASGTTMTGIFTCASGSNGVSFFDLEFDGNGSAAAGAQTVLCDFLTNAPANPVLERCRITRCKGTLGPGNIGGPGGRITECEFTGNLAVDLRFDTGATDWMVTRCTFTNWDASLSALRSSVWILSTAKNLTFDLNYWRNVRAGVFCIESIPTGTAYHTGITITNNVMDGGGFRGTGISGYFDRSNFSHNLMVNGGDDAGAWMGQRNGIEHFGTRTIIAHNIIENGSIVLAKSTGWPNGVGNKIIGNFQRVVQATSTAVQCMPMRDQDDALIQGNIIEVVLSGSATLTAGIYPGTYGTQATMNRVLICDNIVRSSGAVSSGAGIRNLTSASTDVQIVNNIVSGFVDGIRLPATSVDVNLTIRGNNIWNNTTPMNGTPTGLGYVDRGNVKTTGQYSTQTVASGASPALNVGLGSVVLFTATSAATWGAPTNIPPAGDTVLVRITQDATGGRAISWNSAYVFPTAWSNTGNTANTTSTVVFVSDGTRLVAQGANSWY